MPRGDRTGPMGAGPMTGRRAGFCVGNGFPGFGNVGWPWVGYGYGGGGRGWRNMYHATGLFGWQRGAYTPTATPQTEAEILKTRADWLKNQLDAINKRLEELDQ